MKKQLVLSITAAFMSLSAYAQDYKKIHQDLLVIDGHNDVLIESILPGKDISNRIKSGHTDLPRLKEGGVDVQVFAVWSDDKKYQKNAFKHANDQIEVLEELFKKNHKNINLENISEYCE